MKQSCYLRNTDQNFKQTTYWKLGTQNSARPGNQNKYTKRKKVKNANN